MLPRGNPQFRRPVSLRWSLTGILLLLAMFGHDALMASELTDIPVGIPEAASVGVSDGPAVRGVVGVTTGFLTNAHVSHADAECGVSTSPASFQSRFSSILSLPVAVGLSNLPVAITHGTESPVDHILPPSDRRAMLQVYLI